MPVPVGASGCTTMMAHANRHVAPVPPALYQQALRLVFEPCGKTEQYLEHFSTLLAAGESNDVAAGHAVGVQVAEPAAAIRARTYEAQPQGERTQCAGLPSAAGASSPDIAVRPSQRGADLRLLGAFEGQRLLGALLLQFLAGRAAMLWPPGLGEGGDEAAADQLVQAALAVARAGGARLVQCLLPWDQTHLLSRLRRHGFRELAELVYLSCESESFPPAAPSGLPAFEPYCTADRSRLAAVVEATYQGTLDCPALNGVFTAEEALAGYEAACKGDPRWWRLVRHEGQDVGCLLVASYGTGQACELTYMGLVPQYRGLGWGRQIVLHALWLARQAGSSRMVAAVDLANTPALNLYTSAGFAAWDRRIACVCIVD